MDADERRARINEKTKAIIGAAYQVGNELGCGFANATTVDVYDIAAFGNE